MSGPWLLDLFSGAGGAARGYQRAGFRVLGVDTKPQPRYAGDRFVRADAMDALRHWDLSRFAAIHVSPPCQGYSVTASLHDAEYPRLIEPVRAHLKAIGLPYVIENVQGAPLRDWVRLCGSSFGLGVRRHRLFETSWFVMFPPPCAHHLQPEPIDVTGTGGPASRPPGQRGGIHRKPRNLAHAREVMGIDWMSRPELAESVPPAYTEYLGHELVSALKAAA
jgi:DNA (cytosine-5)-methyltransferase 1